MDLRPTTWLKRHSNTDVFCEYCEIFKSNFFLRTHPVSASDQGHYGLVKKANKSHASLAKSFAANTLRARTLEAMKVLTQQVRKTEMLMALQSVVMFLTFSFMFLARQWEHFCKCSDSSSLTVLLREKCPNTELFLVRKSLRFWS